MPKNAKQLANEIQYVWRQAEQEGRDLTPSERQHMAGLVDEAKAQHELEKQMKELSGGMAPAFTDPNASFAKGSGPGDQFIASKGYRAIADPGTRPQSWSTGAVEVSSFGMKAGTLLEGGQGAGLIPVPQVVPGVVEKLFEPLGVQDVFAQGIATTSSLRYVVEGTATNSAAGVAEGGTKPASDLALSTVDEPVKKIATVLTISDELLEDSDSVSSYLNSRLGLFVRLEEERQLLRGAGTNELVGIFGRSGINTYTKLGTDDNATALARVIANTRGSSYLQPDTVIIHPNNWLSTRLLRDGSGGTIGNYYGAGPFGAAYGGQVPTGLFGESIWNTRVVLSTVVGAGTALVGSFGQAAQIYRRGGPTIELTNSHASYFQTNQVMVRAESRLALACYRPAAFTVVSGLV